MAHADDVSINPWTPQDLIVRFGEIPLERIRTRPAPGTATEEDLIAANDRHAGLYELIDGTLVEKTMGVRESYLAILLSRLLGNFVAEHDLGVVCGPDGPYRLAQSQIRLPDVSFVSWERLPEGGLPEDAVCDATPDLAIEVISKGNTRREMQRKLGDYFAAGVRLVWYVYPQKNEVHVYRTADEQIVLRVGDTLDGGELLPGFKIELNKLFDKPRKKK